MFRFPPARPFSVFTTTLSSSLIGLHLIFLVGMGLFCELTMVGGVNGQHLVDSHTQALLEAEALLAGAECDGDKTGEETPKPEPSNDTAAVDTPQPPCPFCQTPHAFLPPPPGGLEMVLLQPQPIYGQSAAVGFRADVTSAQRSRAPPTSFSS